MNVYCKRVNDALTIKNSPKQKTFKPKKNI